MLDVLLCGGEKEEESARSPSEEESARSPGEEERRAQVAEAGGAPQETCVPWMEFTPQSYLRAAQNTERRE